MNLKELKIDNSWTLFLDRDGVINRRIIGGYVLTIEEFETRPKVLESISFFNKIFGRTVVVTNQQCIGKKLLTESKLKNIHSYFQNQLNKKGGHIDRFYFAPNLREENHPLRKPGIGMALKAKEDFPEIEFKKSIIVGDSPSDMEFGKNAGMTTVFIGKEKDELADFVFNSLYAFKLALEYV